MLQPKNCRQKELHVEYYCNIKGNVHVLDLFKSDKFVRDCIDSMK